MITVCRIGYCRTPAPPPAALLASLGVGSTLGSGRWHSHSLVQVVYCGASRSLCQLEKRVQANGANVKHQALMRLVLPQRAKLMDVASLGLPSDWRADEAATRRIGNDWLASGASLGLWVPSFVEPSEMNLLLNPAHPSYSAIQLTVERNPFVFDPRLL